MCQFSNLKLDSNGHFRWKAACVLDQEEWNRSCREEQCMSCVKHTFPQVLTLFFYLIKGYGVMHHNYYSVSKYRYVPFVFAVWNIRSLVLFNLLIFNNVKLLEGWQLEFMSLDSNGKKMLIILKRQGSVATDKCVVS